MKYKHLKYEERIKIEILLKEGYKVSEISRIIGRHTSSVYREIKRNTEGKEIYLGKRANDRSVDRAFWQRYNSPLKDSFTWDYVVDRLQEKKWSPEIIAGRLSVDHPEKKIHFSTIYKFIYDKKFYQHLELSIFLLRKGKSKKWRNIKTKEIEGKVMIQERPEHIDNRDEIGHWESDLMEGIRGDKKTVTVTLERRSRYMVAGMATKKSKDKTSNIIRMIKDKNPKTITVDNGSENAEHKIWEEKLKTQVYFCNPYRSWEKGAVENSIGWLRRSFPKKKSIDYISPQRLAYVVKRYNQTPRKILNYLTPEEVFMRESNAT